MGLGVPQFLLWSQEPEAFLDLEPEQRMILANGTLERSDGTLVRRSFRLGALEPYLQDPENCNIELKPSSTLRYNEITEH